MPKYLESKSGNPQLFWSLVIGAALIIIALTFTIFPSNPVDLPTDELAVKNTTLVKAGPVLMAEEYQVRENPEENLENTFKKPSVVAFSVRIEEHNTEEDYHDINDARRQQLQYLHEVLPYSLMIPTEKSGIEVERMMAEMEQHRFLQHRIESRTASTDERIQYVELHRQKLEEEKSLIQLCENEAANSLASTDEKNAQLCTQVAGAAPERLQVIEESLLELEDILASVEIE